MCVDQGLRTLSISLWAVTCVAAHILFSRDSCIAGRGGGV